MVIKKAFEKLSDERKQQVISVAVMLFVSNEYENVTVRLICSALNININTFYRWFDTKDDLYVYVYRQLSKRSIESEGQQWTIEDYSMTLEGMAEIYSPEELKMLSGWWNLPDEALCKLILDPDESELAYIRKSIEREKSLGRLRQDLDVEAASYLYATSSMLLAHYMRRKGCEDLEELDKSKRYWFYSLLNYGIRGINPYDLTR